MKKNIVICDKCKSKISEDNIFCTKCGAKLIKKNEIKSKKTVKEKAIVKKEDDIKNGVVKEDYRKKEKDQDKKTKVDENFIKPSYNFKDFVSGTAIFINILFWVFVYTIPLSIIYIIYKIYEYKYFSSYDFIKIKDSISDNTKECNDLNEHIEELKLSYSDFKKTDYGFAEYEDDSVYNYKRSKLSLLNDSNYTYNCSLTVCKNASQQPFKYICKYFNISVNEESLSKFETVLNNFSAAEQGKTLLKNQRDKIINSVKANIPAFIKAFSKKRMIRLLGFTDIDFSQLYFPKYTFQYVSAGGNAGTKCTITMNIDNLNRFIEYLSENIKFRKSIAGQRALMTSKLREKIKKRDNYTCKHCKNSTEKEPNLLLEIDHIIPLSKNGLTTEDNLQTLCWKCNRSKGSKIIKD